MANDSYERDYLYINQKNGTLRMSWKIKCSIPAFINGADIADINNDGYPDVFTTDMLPLSDYRIKTTGAFDDISFLTERLRRAFTTIT